MTDLSRSALIKPGRLIHTPGAAAGINQLERILASTARPFVLINERELSVLRRGLTKDGWKRSVYLQPARTFHGTNVGAGILSVANRWLNTEIVIPPQGGHFHAFFCDCGKRLSIPENLLPAKEYICPSCKNAYSGPQLDSAVHYLHHNHLAGAALSLAIVGGIEKKRAYAAKAAEILLKYADAYPSPHAKSLSGGMFAQSLDEAVWVIAMAQAYDLVYHSRTLNDYDKQRIEQYLLRPIAEELMNAGIDGTHGAWRLSAVGVIGMAIKDASLAHYALSAFGSQVGDQLTDNGLWSESVHCHHFYALSAFVDLAEAFYRIGIDIYNWEPRPGKSLKAMFIAPLEYAYPSLMLPAIHNGWFESVLPLNLYEVAYRRFGEPYFSWVLRKGYRFGECPINRFQLEHRDEYRRTSFFALLFGRDMPGRMGGLAFTGEDYDSIGICTLRSGDDLMVTLDYGRFLESGHHDKLAFTLYANGAIAMPDYGTPGFGSDFVEWSRSTPGHNTVVVDGGDQQPSETQRLTHRFVGGVIQCVEAVADDCYPGVTHTRKLVLVGNTCIIADQLASDQTHVYDWLVRCEGEPRLDGDYEQAVIDTRAYGAVEAQQAFKIPGGCSLTWAIENGSLRFHMWPQTPTAQAVLGTCPTESIRRTASFFMCRQQALNTAFLAAIVAMKSGEEADVIRDGGILRISAGDVVDHIFLQGCGVDSSSISLQTDGELAVVREHGSEIIAVALMKGSWVRWNGDLIIECPSMVDFMEFQIDDDGPSIKYYGDTVGIVKLRTNARAMRVNGLRASASRSEGSALVRITPSMLTGSRG